MRLLSKILLGVLAVGVVGGVGWVVFDRIAALRSEPEREGGGARVAVEVASVERGSLRELRQLTGTVQAESSYEVAARVDGTIERLHVDLGDEVGWRAEGALIAELEDREHVQEVEQQEAEVEVARARLEEARSNWRNAERRLERVRQLYEREVASSSELDDATSNHEARAAAVQVAASEVERQEAALRRAKLRRDYTQVRARWNGETGDRRYVARRLVDEGATVSANQGIVRLVDLDRVRVVVYVDERDYMRLDTGQRAELHVGRGTERERLEGRVRRVSPQFGEQTRQAEVHIAVDNEGHVLKPGMFVQVDLELGSAGRATVVPRSALVQREGGQGVFVVESVDEAGEGEVRFVPVSTGIREGSRVQVMEPAELEGLVVTLGQHLLADGMAVRVERGGLEEQLEQALRGGGAEDGRADD